MGAWIEIVFTIEFNACNLFAGRTLCEGVLRGAALEISPEKVGIYKDILRVAPE